MEDDNEITNYWSKLLLFLIIVFFGYITYYKFMVFDKKVPTDNKVKETEKNNENIVDPGIDDVHYADDTGEDIKIDENNTEENNENIVDPGIDTVEQYFKSKNINVKETRDFTIYTPVYDSDNPEISEPIYKEAIEQLENISEFAKTFKLYKFNNCYVLTESNFTIGIGPEFESIIILDNEFKEISRSNRIFQSTDVIYLATILCDLNTDEDIPKNVKNNESHIVNKLYKIDTKTGEKEFMDYVLYNGSTAC